MATNRDISLYSHTGGGGVSGRNDHRSCRRHDTGRTVHYNTVTATTIK